ncbi:MAG TPA: DUF1802 family protein, partial [Verrucomicrobiae bacterium]|nr:DUF1802 family protein [Verrucomicrobiae bacterium]
TPAAAAALRGQHIWRDEVIAERFDWGKSKQIHALALRVYRLPQPLNLPMSPAYGGCKSWITLEQDIPTPTTDPVLTDAEFAEKLKAFHSELEAEPK